MISIYVYIVLPSVTGRTCRHLTVLTGGKKYILHSLNSIYVMLTGTSDENGGTRRQGQVLLEGLNSRDRFSRRDGTLGAGFDGGARL